MDYPKDITTTVKTYTCAFVSCRSPKSKYYNLIAEHIFEFTTSCFRRLIIVEVGVFGEAVGRRLVVQSFVVVRVGTVEIPAVPLVSCDGDRRRGGISGLLGRTD